MTRRSNRGGDGRATNPSGPLIVKVSTARGCIERRSIERTAQRARVIKLPFYIRILSRPARGARRGAARRHARALRPPSSSFPPLGPLPLAISFFLDFIDSIHPRCGLFSPSRPLRRPSSLSLRLSPIAGRQSPTRRVAPRARPAARFGQFAAESGEHSRFNYTDNEVCSDQMPKG